MRADQLIGSAQVCFLTRVQDGICLSEATTTPLSKEILHLRAGVISLHEPLGRDRQQETRHRFLHGWEVKPILLADRQDTLDGHAQDGGTGLMRERRTAAWRKARIGGL
jgi:hypothetical protein